MLSVQSHYYTCCPLGSSMYNRVCHLENRKQGTDQRSQQHEPRMPEAPASWTSISSRQSLHSAESFANLKSVDCCLSQLSRHKYGRQGTYGVYPQHIKQYKLLTDLCYLDKPVTPFAWSPWVTQVLQQRLRSKLARLLNPPLLDLYVSLVACPKIWTCNSAVLFAVHCNEP